MRDSEHETSESQGTLPIELMIWLSPAFPVGGFAYSQGLESAVAEGWVTDSATLGAWVRVTALHGALRNDLILLSLVMRARGQHEIGELRELAAALQPSAERAKEATDQGRSFWMAYCAAWAPVPSKFEPDAERLTLPVAVGLAARDYGIDPLPALQAYAVAFISNQVSAAIRLGVVGQFSGQRVIADALPGLRRLCSMAVSAGQDDLGTCTFGADLASMFHETQTTRLFRS